MKRFFLTSGFLLLVAASTADAQFGSGIVYDPTQSVHAAEQILQGSQLYTTTVETSKNIIGAYNLAQRMASAPEALYTAYVNMGKQTWTSITRPANTYGNTEAWINAALTGNNAAYGNQQASLPHPTRISGYSSLDAQGQQQLAAQGATADLNDTANATTLQTLGTIRANAPQREADISRLETASHSVDPEQQTELATLQRINQALLLQLRTQQESNQMTQAQSLQQLVGQKQQQDELKMVFDAADGYQTNYNSKTAAESSASVNRVFQY